MNVNDWNIKRLATKIQSHVSQCVLLSLTNFEYINGSNESYIKFDITTGNQAQPRQSEIKFLKDGTMEIHLQ